MSNPWGVCHWQIVTLLELLETSAEAYWRMSSIIGQLIVKIEMVETFGGAALPDQNLNALGNTLGELRQETERLRLRSAAQHVRRIMDYVTGGGRVGAGVFLGDMRRMFIELQHRMADELMGRVFLMIPEEQSEFYKPDKPLFGVEVDNAFPLAGEDISEAGKCFALGRSTATVFHLMRAMESAVQRLSTKLNITNTEREWGKLLSDIAKAIEAMPKGAERNKWSESHTHLYHVKQAWRNDTMHPKQTYTAEEAKAIFDAVKVFMRDLATLV